MQLSEACRTPGLGLDPFELVVCANPQQHPDRLGRGSPHGVARALKGDRVAVMHDDWDHAYAVSHERAEALTGFKRPKNHAASHHEQTWVIQCNLLAHWHKLRGRPRVRSCEVPQTCALREKFTNRRRRRREKPHV